MKPARRRAPPEGEPLAMPNAPKSGRSHSRASVVALCAAITACAANTDQNERMFDAMLGGLAIGATGVAAIFNPTSSSVSAFASSLALTAETLEDDYADSDD